MMMDSTYQTVVAMNGKNHGESFVIAAQIVQISTFTDKNEFLKLVKKQRAEEPKTGRFEQISDLEAFDPERAEVCVRHTAVSKDFGAKRGGTYTIYETLGMNCIHPYNPSIDVFIELSRKAPPGDESADFKRWGDELLRSVKFNKFR
jgi:hypothetical protein